MKKIFKSALFMLTVTTGLTLASCSDDDLPAADALFRPVLTEADNIEHGLDENLSPYMDITWDQYTDATEYVLSAVANDGSDSQTITTEATECTFRNLQYDKEYNVSIRCVNSATGLQSKDFTITTTTMDYPTHLSSIGASDVIDIAAKVSWSGVEYDSLQVIKDSNDSLVTTVELTPEDNVAKTVTVSGLAPKTTYRVAAYTNDNYLGKKRFTTTAEEDFGDVAVVDLRNLDDEEGYKYLTTEHLQEIADQYPDQNVTIVLKGGNHYRLQGLNLPQTAGTIKFITGLSLAGYAVFDCASEFGVPNGVTIGGLELEKVNFYDYEGNKTSSNFGGHYLINQQSDGNLKNLTFKNCQIKYKRGVVRARTALMVDNLTFDDCVLDSIGGYGITTAEDNASVKNIKAVNSTFANCEKLFVATKNVVPESVSIESCTFVYCNKKNNIFDFGKDFGNLKVKNCLFGKGWANDNNGYNKTKPECTDVYFTSDYSWALNADGIPNKPIGETIKETTDELFQNPALSDFTLKVKGFTFGDPRWYE